MTTKLPTESCPSSVVIRGVSLPWEQRQYLAVTIDNVFTQDECNDLIRRSEGAGYQEALVNIGGGRQKKMTDYRNSDRCIIDDEELAGQIWGRIQQALAAVNDHDTRRDLQLDQLQTRMYGIDGFRKPMQQWHAVGLNERLRFLRYDVGQFFKAHSDGCYLRETGPRAGEMSFVTCQLYLNGTGGGAQDPLQGGATTFLCPFDEDIVCHVHPKAGSVLLFDHDLYHQGTTVEAGRKYVIRTDVMYTNKGPGHEYAAKIDATT